MSLVDLTNITTEQKGEEYSQLELKPLDEQFSCLLNSMIHAINTVENNKNNILTIVQNICSYWRNTPVTDRLICMVGAGTSGRLALLNSLTLDTEGQFNLDYSIAGGLPAFTKAVEGTEDKEKLARIDIQKKTLNKNSVVIGISASGRTPYTNHYLQKVKEKKSMTISITNSPNSILEQTADHSITHVTGAEYPRGSTRMKSGTSQHLTLQLLLKTLVQALAKKNIDTYFAQELEFIRKSIQNIQNSKQILINNAQELTSHFFRQK